MTPPVRESSETGLEIGATVKINNLEYQVPRTYASLTLNDYLRNHIHLTGTKVLCREGGCGVCTVFAKYPDPSGSGNFLQRAVNSCLTPILSCDGWEITTVEGLGDQQKPHPIQQRLTDYYGTQCGYCTPGWIMSMYSLSKNYPGGTLTKKIVEDSLDGNICRCTGYRPILDAFKSFAKDEYTEADGMDVDLEDLPSAVCPKTGKSCSPAACHEHDILYVKPLPAVVCANAPTWCAPTSLAEVYQLQQKYAGKKVYYLVGHTGIGVYDEGPYDVMVDLKRIPELFKVEVKSDKLVIGAGVVLTDVISMFNREAKVTAGFEYLERLAVIISKTAHTAVRNAGSIGGNLAMKNRHNEFPSDSYTCLAVADARIILGPEGKSYSMEEFLGVDLSQKLILRIELKPFGKEFVFRTFKIMIRAQNSHGIINAGFRLKVDRSQAGKLIVTEKPSIVLGNITEKFVHARQTETFLTGKDLAKPDVLRAVLETLEKEVKPEAAEDEASPAYRRSLSVSVFYKFLLEIVGPTADLRYQSGSESLMRPLSSGSQAFQTIEKNWPVTKPMPKLESLAQCTGEAKYISDIDDQGLLHAAFATTTQGNASIFRIDPSDALAVPGVLKVFTAADIPGKNDTSAPPEKQEELLASRKVEYCGQPVAIVVGLTKVAAEEGAKRVKVEYLDIQPVILTPHDAIREKSFFGEPDVVEVGGDVESVIKKAPKRVSGEVELGSQVHFHMETQTTVAYPTEDGLNLEAGTQWIDHVQDAVSRVCGITKNAINVNVKRLGGAFGGKISRNNIISAACSMAAVLTRRPVKMHMSLWDNSKVIGKRFPYYMKYDAGFDETGKLLGIKMDIFCNLGYQKNDSPTEHAKHFIDNVYKCAAWKLTFHACKTNLPANTHCRGPGSTEAIYFVETIMEHGARSLGKIPIEIKQLNYYKEGDKALDGSKMTDIRAPEVTQQLLKNASISERQTAIADFNRAHRWNKRGLAVVPLRYAATYQYFNYGTLVAIYHTGGFVSVTHGGIEMGQGINTKVAQAVARELDIDMKYVKVHSTQNITNANGFATGGSMSSELACQGAINCCKELNDRINPIRKAQPDKTWEEVIEKCFGAAIDLSARHWLAPKVTQPAQYYTYACMATEVELDVLTGEHQIRRVDLLYDCGESISPLIDIGQIEGAIVMGIGYFTSEEVLYDSKTGANLTTGTWKYKPPMTKDIPVDLRVELLRNAPHPDGILRSKLVAEPPLTMTCSVVFALREAIRASVAENGDKTGENWVQLGVMPLTVERAQLLCGTDLSMLRFHD